MAQTNEEMQDVLDRLATLSPGPGDAPQPAPRALAQLKQRVSVSPTVSLGEYLRSMMMSPNRRLATAVISLVLILGVALSFPSVRAAASDFLGLFRVQKFTAISISPERLAVLERVAEQGMMPGELEILHEPGATTPVGSAKEAGSMIGVTARTLRELGAPAAVYVVEGGEGRFTIDLVGARAILEAAGADPLLLPDNLDGQSIHVTVFSGVAQNWQNGVSLLQAESPVVEYPDGLDPVQLGEALLQLLGMNEDEAQRLAQQIDWTSTLLLPIPREAATFNEVTVHGASGLALNSLDGQNAALLWQENGMIYLLTGQGGSVDLLSLARSLR